MVREPIRTELIPIEAIRGARTRIADLALRTPLVRLNVDDQPHIHLKLENLQPIGSFKLRGAGNAMRLLDQADLDNGVCTASAGNMGQGVAHIARTLGVACTVAVPDHAPQTKLDALRRFGAHVKPLPFDRWWEALMTHRLDDVPGRFIHPVCDANVIAGNATIGAEILEQLPEVETIVVPFGGGGLSCGIASAIRALKPSVRIVCAEVDTAAPLHASRRAGVPTSINYRASFVDGIGGRSVLHEMWPLLQTLIDDVVVVSLDQIADAMRSLVTHNRVVAEGAGAAAVAAAYTLDTDRPIACVVSGGNVDPHVLAAVLSGETPT